jgi:nucleoside-diphosphate-sugar epimerase
LNLRNYVKPHTYTLAMHLTSGFENRKYLITGGDGFIGINLSKFLLSRGDHVHIIDNNITSNPVLEHDRLTRTICDVEKISIDDLPWFPDCIFHLASVAVPTLYMKNPKLVISPNVFGTKKVCEIAMEVGARVIFTSTSEVYGNSMDHFPPGTKVSESNVSLSTMLTSRSPYSISKKMGEEILAHMLEAEHSRCSVRLFNVVGPNMDSKTTSYGRVVPNFLRALRSGESLPIYGTGMQTRSFLWIGDAVEALVKIGDYDGELPMCLNIGNPHATTILQLAKKFEEISGISVGFSHSKVMPEEPFHRCPDISLAKEIIDWSPTKNLEEIIFMILDD